MESTHSKRRWLAIRRQPSRLRRWRYLLAAAAATASPTVVGASVLSLGQHAHGAAQGRVPGQESVAPFADDVVAESQASPEQVHDARLVVELAASSPEMSSVSACESFNEVSSLCLQTEFSQGLSGVTEVACRAFDEAPSSTPSWWRIVSAGGAAVQRCELNAVRSTCTVLLEAGIRAGTSYHAFCVQLSPEVEPGRFRAPIVLPRCEGGAPCGVELKTITKPPASFHRTFGVEDLIFVLLLMLYVGWSYMAERVRVLHETGMAAVVGIFAGCVIKMGLGRSVAFSYDMFSFVLLPMVIFGAGFNLQKKRFFEYAPYILSFGIIGTVVMFLVLYHAALLLPSFRTLHGGPVKLDPQRSLIMAAVLASSDTVAPVSFLPVELFPTLFAVVFGEGVMNDVVSILLSSATASCTKPPPPGSLALQILYFLAMSGLIGVVFGLGIALLFKKGEKLQDGTTKPVSLLVLCCYLCYIVAEMTEVSPIFALFVCSILCGHYAKYSISPEACRFAEELAEFLSYIAEAFVFGYFGVTAVGVVTDQQRAFSPSMILFYVGAILASRIVAVTVLALCLRILCWKRLKLSAGEFGIVIVAGCLRGTIAFALILHSVPPAEHRTFEDEILITTVLGIIVVNCIVLGALFPLLLRCLGIVQPAPGVTPSAGRSSSSSLPASGAQSTIRVGIHRVVFYLDGFLQPIFRARSQRAPTGVGRNASAPAPYFGRRASGGGSGSSGGDKQGSGVAPQESLLRSSSVP